MPRIAIVGAGFSGLSAACYLSGMGYEVDVYEKNTSIGGRARQMITGNGYIFDMGPSWYWMPDIFERFFNDFGYKSLDFYKLERLAPSFEIIFGDGKLQIPAASKALEDLFESVEKGAGQKLQAFMKDARQKYEIGMKEMVYKPALSLFEFINIKVLSNAFKMDLFTGFDRHVKKYFNHPWLTALMEFPVLFLGAMPKDTPALYSMMNYAGLHLGTWYPMGGFGKITNAMEHIAKEKGATFYLNTPVQKIIVENYHAKGISTGNKNVFYDAIVASADYHHVETDLLPDGNQNYTQGYWNKKTLAPSCLIFYLGIDKKLPGLKHHTLFFEEDRSIHTREIYIEPQWPTKPLFYVCCPSQTDTSIAPAGKENLFFLMPLAPGLEDSIVLREKYFSILIDRLEKHTETSIKDHIDFKKSYCIEDFKLDYHSFKGNAYGLANTVRQTAILKPKMRNKKVRNLFYAGQLTVPGPGVPPALISGKIAATEIHKFFKHENYETVV